jgi:hypothetical protein
MIHLKYHLYTDFEDLILLLSLTDSDKLLESNLLEEVNPEVYQYNKSNQHFYSNNKNALINKADEIRQKYVISFNDDITTLKSINFKKD